MRKGLVARRTDDPDEREVVLDGVVIGIAYKVDKSLWQGQYTLRPSSGDDFAASGKFGTWLSHEIVGSTLREVVVAIEECHNSVLGINRAFGRNRA